MKHRRLLGLAIFAASLLTAAPALANGGPYEEPEQPPQEGDTGGGPTDEQTQGQQEEGQEEVTPPEEEEPQAIEEPYEPPMAVGTEQQEQPATILPVGMSLTIGGGLNGFTDGDFNDFVDTGGGWEGRLAVGTRLPIGLEAAYVGTANDIDAIGVADNARLISNGLEGAIRLDLTRTMIKPYVLAGAGWKHYSVQNTNVNTSDLQDSDNVVTFPLAAGLNYKYKRFIGDVRGTFSPTIDNELFRSDVGNDENQLHTWKATANVGFEF